MEPKNQFFRNVILPAGIALLAVLGLIAVVWVTGWPRGIDAWGHFYKAEYLADQMRQNGLGAYFTTAWLPNWYLGDPFLTYYPPLTTLVLAPLVYLSGNIDIANKIFLTLYFLVFATGVFLYLNRNYGGWPALFGTLLAVGASYQLRTVFFEGNYPRALAIMALPALAILTDRLLTHMKRRTVSIFLLSLAWAWTILAHPQQALLFAIGLAGYIVFRLVLDPAVPIYRSVYSIGALLFGAMIASPWLLPAYSHGELTNVPFLPAEKIQLFSASLSGFLPGLDLNGGQILFGIGTIALGLLVVASRPDPRRVSWFLAGLLTVLFSLGPQGVLFSLIPLNNQLLPERFLNFSVFAIPVVASGIFPLTASRRLLKLAIIALLFSVDVVPALALVPGGAYPTEQSVLASVDTSSGGRVALLTYPEPSSLEVYFSGQNADIINGWALENTPHNVALRRVLSAPSWGPEYLRSLFARWDVRTVIVSDDPEAEKARTALAADGFRLQTAAGRYQVWQSGEKSARVQRIPQNSMLVVGDQLSPFLAAFPFAEETSTADYFYSHSGRLLEYPMLGLYRFGTSSAQIKDMEVSLRNYLEAGGTVIADLSGMEDTFGRTLDFLGVHVYRLTFRNRIPMQWSSSAQSFTDMLLLSDVGETEWSGATYSGLDSIEATVTNDEGTFSIFGYKQIGKGRIWLLGANLLYYAQLSPQSHLSQTIRDIVLKKATVNTQLHYDPISVEKYAETANGISFSYQIDQSCLALISYTYSPRWSAFIDGAPASILPRDNLIRIMLPSGSHHVDFVYQPLGTVWPWMGWFLGGVGVLACLFLILAERLWVKGEEPRRSLLDFFQMSENAPKGTAFSPCGNCGFRLAESAPPTPVTYPFHVSLCPICGAQMNDDGFVTGRALEPSEKSRLLTQWLRDHGYDPKTVYSTWGFSIEEFFEK